MEEYDGLRKRGKDDVGGIWMLIIMLGIAALIAWLVSIGIGIYILPIKAILSSIAVGAICGFFYGYADTDRCVTNRQSESFAVCFIGVVPIIQAIFSSQSITGAVWEQSVGFFGGYGITFIFFSAICFLIMIGRTPITNNSEM